MNSHFSPSRAVLAPDVIFKALSCNATELLIAESATIFLNIKFKAKTNVKKTKESRECIKEHRI